VTQSSENSEPSLVELLSDPEARAQWDKMVEKFRPVKGRKPTQKASETTEVRAKQDRLQQGPVVSEAFLRVEAPIPHAFPLAKSLEDSGLDTFVRHEEVAIDAETGEAKVLMRPTGRLNWQGKQFRAPGEVWTDARGIALSVVEVSENIHGHQHTEPEKVKTRGTQKRLIVWPPLQSDDLPKDESGLSNRAKKLLHTLESRWFKCERSGGWYRNDTHVSEVITNNAILHNEAIQRRADIAQKVLDGIKDAPEVEPVEPETKQFRTAREFRPESPSKPMSALERFQRAKAANARRASKAANIQPQIDKWEAEIAETQEKLAPVVAKIKAIRKGNGLVRRPHTLMFREEVLPQLEDRATDLRGYILYCREKIAEVRKNNQ